MASFSHNSKIEVLENEIKGESNCLAFLYGILRTSGKLNEKNSIEITTDIKELTEVLSSMIKKLFNEKVEQKTEKNFRVNKSVYFKICFSSSLTHKLFSVFKRKVGENILFEEINREILKTNDNKISYIKGLFLGAATSSIKISERANEKTSSGYHLEFNSKNKRILEELEEFLLEYNIFSKIIKRKNIFVLYFKEANQVSDILALVGAYSAVLVLQDEMVKRELRNKVNRQTNCENANITKTVEASLKQLQAIEKIDKIIGIENLPPDLQEIAILRLANQEETLDTLIKLSNIKLTKSGLNHRFRKILDIANKLD